MIGKCLKFAENFNEQGQWLLKHTVDHKIIHVLNISYFNVYKGGIVKRIILPLFLWAVTCHDNVVLIGALRSRARYPWQRLVAVILNILATMSRGSIISSRRVKFLEMYTQTYTRTLSVCVREVRGGGCCKVVIQDVDLVVRCVCFRNVIILN